LTGLLFTEDGGRTLFVFLGLSVVLGGGAAFSTGRALAKHWRPFWLAPLAMLPLAAGVRFLHYALFDEPLISLRGFAADYGVVLGLAFLGFRLARKSQMKRQYGWITTPPS
jgi:hypothetical protein